MSHLYKSLRKYYCLKPSINVSTWENTRQKCKNKKQTTKIYWFLTETSPQSTWTFSINLLLTLTIKTNDVNEP
jgi:hypothetical protein